MQIQRRLGKLEINSDYVCGAAFYTITVKNAFGSNGVNKLDSFKIEPVEVTPQPNAGPIL